MQQSQNGLQFKRRFTKDGTSVFDQFEYDYRFNSSKLERAFALEATSYADGIAAALASSTP